MTIADAARAYLAKLPRSISGSGGRTALFEACAVLMRGFSLSEVVAFEIISEWNQTSCDPPWRDRDLREKLREGGKAARAQGYLLREGGRASYGSLCGGEAAEKAAKRAKWPAFQTLSEDSMRKIADLRKLPPAAVHAVAAGGFLKGAIIDGHRSFVIAEGIFAQARRFDGQPFTRCDGEEIKAKNLSGSQGAFIGRSWLGDVSCPVLLVEGAIALIEATAAVLHADADVRGWAVVAATSAGSRFTPEWLDHLRGRRVRIVPDVDLEGMRSCGIWTAALEGVRARVDAVRLPPELKDLGPIVADPATHHTIIESIFSI